MALFVLVLVVLGKIHFIGDINYSSLGIVLRYDQAAKYNPLFELLILAQFVSMWTLPLILAIFRKWLKIRVLPWILVAPLYLLGTYLVSHRGTEFDASASSLAPTYFGFELIFVGAVLFSYLLYYLFTYHRNTMRAS
jgi:hypothetical protein